MNRTILRRDTLNNWLASDPILALGEPGLELEEVSLKAIKLKIGDGKTPWSNLPYFLEDISVEIPDFHNHNNLEVLNQITQEKINQWDSGTGSEYGNPLDGSFPVIGNILPDFANTRNLGSQEKPYNHIYAKDLFLSANSLYVNNKKVIEDNSDTITVSTSENQDLAIRTKGVGDIWLHSDDRVNLLARAGLEALVSSFFPAKNLSFTNQSAGGNITFYATGANSQIQFSAVDTINLSAPWVRVNSQPIATIQQIDDAITSLKQELDSPTGNISINGGYF